MAQKLDSKTIEEIGVGEIRKYFNYSSTISPEIPTGDKGPVWDGSLLLYSMDGKNRNSSLIGPIHTQVKAKCNTTIPSSTARYRVKVENLSIYQNNLGVAFFLVYINPQTQESTLFYSLLAPVDLKRYITNANGKKSIIIELNVLPPLDQEIENQFLDFYYDCKRQAEYSQPIFLNDVEKDIECCKFHFTYQSKNRYDLLRFITTRKHFIYATFKGDPTSSLHPLGDQRYQLKAVQEAEVDISVENKTYFNKCLVEIDNGEVFVVIKDVMRFQLPMESDSHYNGKLNITPNFHTLSQKIHILEFLSAVINSQSFFVNGSKMIVSDIGENDFVNIKEDLDGCHNLRKVLDLLHVNEDLDVSRLTSNDISNINFLINYFLFHKEDVMPDIKPPRLVKMDLSNISILFFVDQKEEQGSLRIHSAYDLKAFDFYTAIGKSDREIAVPPYVGYGKDAFRDVNNINFPDILLAFQEKQSDDNGFYQAMNWTVLRMIMGYDAQKKHNKVLLETALEMTKWLETEDPDEASHLIHVINRLQIIKRLRKLNIEEEDALMSILDMSDCSNEMKFAAHLLLNNTDLALKYFDRLDKSVQQLYKNELPLFNLIDYHLNYE